MTIRTSTDVHSLPQPTQELLPTQKVESAEAAQQASLGEDGIEAPARRNQPTTALPPPTTPAVKLDTASTSGALSFGQQLSSLGPPAASSDDLLARFLKLAILSGTLDKVSEYLAGEGSSILMQGALSNARESLYAQAESLREQADKKDEQAQQKAEHAQAAQRKGGEAGKSDGEAERLAGEAVALHAEAEGMREEAGEKMHSYMAGQAVSATVRAGARDDALAKRAHDTHEAASRLVSALANNNRKLDAFAEAEKSRAEVARLVIEMVDRKAEAVRASLRYR